MHVAELINALAGNSKRVFRQRKAFLIRAGRGHLYFIVS
jgi:hypothetical protein